MTQNNSSLVDALNKLLEGVAGMAGDSSETLGLYVDLERSLLTQYKELIKERLADESATRMTQATAKLMMTAFMETAAIQRDAQKSLLESQSRFADNYLSFLDQIAKEVDRRRGPAKTEGQQENDGSQVDG